MAEEPGRRASLTERHGTAGAPVTRVGVAGWSYPDWKGTVYPPGRRVDPLAYLSRYFDALEINSPFYRIPTARAAASWTRRVRHNAAFRFTLKLYRGFTHERRYDAGDVGAFRDALEPLASEGRLGAVLLQFPWSFKNDAPSRDVLQDLLERFDDHPLVVEVRHASWNRPEFFHHLADRGVGFCNIDQPLIGRSLGPSSRSTSPVGYVRLHGRNYADWFREEAGRDERYDYLYTEEELDPWLSKIAEVGEGSPETYVVTNNHFRGQSVVNALQIRSRLESRPVPAPACLVERYPVLSEVVRPEGDSQGRLF